MQALAAPDTHFVQAVRDAFRHCSSLLALSRSPLAADDLIGPALVLDTLTPTLDERGMALRIALQWAMEQLAPAQLAPAQLAPAPAQLAADAPFRDDPTLRDPRWWPYHLLRLFCFAARPAGPAAMDGGLAEALMAATGIPTVALLHAERMQAVRNAALWLYRHRNEGIGAARMRDMALAAVLDPLQGDHTALALLSVASLFPGVFSRATLLAVAHDDGIHHRDDGEDAERALDSLLRRRCLLAGDGGAQLWMSPVLRASVYGHQPQDRLQRRHLLVAGRLLDAGQTSACGWRLGIGSPHPVIDAARHYWLAGRLRAVADLLLGLPVDLLDEHADEVLPCLESLAGAERQRPGMGHAEQVLTGGQLLQLYLLLADLLERRNRTDDAIAACNEALRYTQSPAAGAAQSPAAGAAQSPAAGAAEMAEVQGRVLRRMGRLLEDQDPERALACYRLALERLPGSDAEVPALLRDRAMLLLLRRAWEDAEQDLLAALQWFGSQRLRLETGQRPQLETGQDIVGEGSASRLFALQADLHEALSMVRRGQGDSSAAVASLQTALEWRRQAGDRMRLARSCNNLGILCHVMGEYGTAIAAYSEALPIFEGLGHHELAATALLNIGTAYHFAGQQAEAEEVYRRCLTMADRLGLALTEVRAHANLAEVLADQGRDEQALGHWQLAHELAVAAGYADEVAYLRELLARYPPLEQQVQGLDTGPAQSPAAGPAQSPAAGPTQSPAAGAAAVESGLHAGRQDAERATVGMEWGALDADETAAMLMARTTGRVTATGLMRSAGVSKATATRKLAHLATVGLLARFGQGRGTWYMERRAGAGERDREALQARLDLLLDRFAASHGVAGFTVGALFLVQPPAAGAAQPPAALAHPEGRVDGGPGAQARRFDVAVRFLSPPDLRAFFELEQQLCEETGWPIRLLWSEGER